MPAIDIYVFDEYERSEILKVLAEAKTLEDVKKVILLLLNTLPCENY